MTNKKFSIVTTTINNPVLLDDYANDCTNHDYKNVSFIVIGDKKTDKQAKPYVESLNDKFTTFIELYGFNNEINIDSGIAYLINDKLQFDTYFGTGLNAKMIFGSIGLSYLYLK